MAAAKVCRSAWNVAITPAAGNVGIGAAPDNAFRLLVNGTPADDYGCIPDHQDLPNFTVPAEQFFVLGDNRDASSDSRVWGFVPDQNIVGRAF